MTETNPLYSHLLNTTEMTHLKIYETNSKMSVEWKFVVHARNHSLHRKTDNLRYQGNHSDQRNAGNLGNQDVTVATVINVLVPPCKVSVISV